MDYSTRNLVVNGIINFPKKKYRIKLEDCVPFIDLTLQSKLWEIKLVSISCMSNKFYSENRLIKISSNFCTYSATEAGGMKAAREPLHLWNFGAASGRESFYPQCDWNVITRPASDLSIFFDQIYPVPVALLDLDETDDQMIQPEPEDESDIEQVVYESDMPWEVAVHVIIRRRRPFCVTGKE